MTKRVLIFVFLLSGSVFAGTCGNGYSFSYKITLNKPSSTLTNFPFLLGFNDGGVLNTGLNSVLGDLRTVANGGKVSNTAANSISVTGPADLVFCDAASAGNGLKYETATYSASTGRAEFWVLIPSLSGSSNTQIWMFVGNASVNTTQQDLSLWTDAGFSLVCHESDGSSLNIKCSKSLGTEVNSNAATASASPLGGAANFVASSHQGIDTGGSAYSATQTAEMWYKFPSTLTNCNQSMVSQFSLTPSVNGWQYTMVTSGGGCSTTTINNFIQYVAVNGGTSGAWLFGSNIVPNTWTSVATTQTGSTVVEYINGAVVGPSNISTPQSIGSNTGNVWIGENLNAGTSSSDGQLDEIRISPSVRTAAWLAETYAVERPDISSFKIEATFGTTPQIKQFTRCSGSNIGTVSCVFPFDITSGSSLIVEGEYVHLTTCNTGVLTDSLSTSYSVANSKTDAGGSNDKLVCIFDGVAPSSGANTVSYASGAPTAFHYMKMFEIGGTRLSVSQTSTQSATPSGNPITLPSVTVPTASSLMFCNAVDLANGGFTSMAPSTLIQNASVLTYSFGYAYGIVGSGSQNCTLSLASPTSDAAALTVFGPAVSSSKQRASQIF